MSQSIYNHALIVGGSGMLAEACLHLASKGTICSVVGRDPLKLKRLKELSFIYPGKINPVISDYTDLPQFLIDITMAEKKFGMISLAVVWIHNTAPRAALQLAGLLNYHACKFVHVLGSSSMEKPENLNSLKDSFGFFDKIQYCPVVLGYKKDGDNTRWLSNQEISKGVIQAIESEKPVGQVGLVDKYKKDQAEKTSISSHF